VVANESYREYVARLQTEYAEAVGAGQALPTPPNARKRREVRLKKGFELNPEFQALWKRIAQRTRYRVALDTEALIAACAAAVGQIVIEPLRVRVERGMVREIGEQGEMEARLLGQSAYLVHREYEIPHVTAKLAEETHLTRRTLRRILERAGNLRQIFDNPAEYLQRAAEAINRAKRRFLVEGVHYVEVDDHYRMGLFENLQGYEQSLLPIEKSIYDQIIVDSGIERDFAQELEALDEVQLFVKLPDWFVVPTPIGTYNPDWAIVFHLQDAFGEVREKVYLVSETKGTTDEEERRGTENLKITCARRHFAHLDVRYDDVVTAEDLLERLR
jgi:type III restriction enzyme